MNEKPERFSGRVHGRTSPTVAATAAAAPEIEIHVGEMERAVDEAEAALIAAQPTRQLKRKSFAAATGSSRWRSTKPRITEARSVETQVIVEVGEYALAERLADRGDLPEMGRP